MFLVCHFGSSRIHLYPSYLCYKKNREPSACGRPELERCTSSSISLLVPLPESDGGDKIVAWEVEVHHADAAGSVSAALPPPCEPTSGLAAMWCLCKALGSSIHASFLFSGPITDRARLALGAAWCNRAPANAHYSPQTVERRRYDVGSRGSLISAERPPHAISVSWSSCPGNTNADDQPRKERRPQRLSILLRWRVRRWQINRVPGQ